MTKNKLQKLSSLGVASVLLGSVLAPVAVSATTANTESANTNLEVTINSVISISTSEDVSFDITPTAAAVSSNSDLVTVSTNDVDGYSLSLSMDGMGLTLDGDNGGSFGPTSGNMEEPAVLDVNTWGFALASGGVGSLTADFSGSYIAEDSNLSSTSKWAAVPASDEAVVIKATDAPDQDDETTVWFGAKADATQPQGVYTGVVKYTATVNPL